MRAYPLEIENVGEDDYVLMSRGHHDPHEFMRAVAGLVQYRDWPMGEPLQCWWHATPIDGGTRYRESFAHTRGSFPATVSSEAHGDRRYRPPESGKCPVHGVLLVVPVPTMEGSFVGGDLALKPADKPYCGKCRANARRASTPEPTSKAP